jgi:Tfp pilus assembly protein PilF
LKYCKKLNVCPLTILRSHVLWLFLPKKWEFSDAREQYELAIVLSQRTPQLHYWFGKFLLHSEENVDEAVEQFRIAHDLDLDSTEVSLALARGYLFQHNLMKHRNS